MKTVYKLTEDQIKELATKFFFHWYNAPGANTMQGFDGWWEENKEKYQDKTQIAINESRKDTLRLILNILNDGNSVNEIKDYIEVKLKQLSE
ncbi:MAG: hypothetical protein LBQ39_07795 [Tannerellaceae bacterium]|jgi:hypothetical protein|nr:hypothetical protein [Tannerellaceae bacterium]